MAYTTGNRCCIYHRRWAAARSVVRYAASLMMTKLRMLLIRPTSDRPMSCRACFTEVRSVQLGMENVAPLYACRIQMPPRVRMVPPGRSWVLHS